MKTIALSPAWDLETDANGNIAAADSTRARAQDAASSIRTFIGECRFSAGTGVPYWERVLGQSPPLELVRAYIVEAATLVPGIELAEAVIGAADREVTGYVRLYTADGVSEISARAV